MRRFLLAVIFLSATGPSFGGVYADEMGKCLVRSTSSEDKTALVRWIFATSALHPDVRPISNVPDAEREAMNREMAAMVERLTTDVCRTETKEAIRYEGMQMAFQTSFALLGQVAMQELMTQKEVAAGFEAYSKYLDEEKFKALAGQ